MTPSGTRSTVDREAIVPQVPARAPRPGRNRPWVCPGRVWALIWVLAFFWSVSSFLGRDGAALNIAGLARLGEFWAAALRPEVSADFLRGTASAAGTTLAFAVLGTVSAVTSGLVLGVLTSRAWWDTEDVRGARRGVVIAGALLTRVGLGLPRGIHEAVWGLLFIILLGRDPLVGILAIAIPFGAITAKVYSEILDESDARAYRALRAQGAGKLSALAYGLLPQVRPALTSYAFYRFECAVRSAVILGMFGVGGLGLQLSLSFSAVQFHEMWTTIYALIAMSIVIDWWGGVLRRKPGGHRWRISLITLAGLVVYSLWHLQPRPERWFSERILTALKNFSAQAFPPSLPDGGWSELAGRTIETFQLSLVAASLASVAAILVCFVAARGHSSPIRSVLARVVRGLLHVARVIPPPAWALLVLFFVYPGPLAGALALGIYTFGVLGRLFSEVVEDLDPGPRLALTGSGVGPVPAFAYATLPAASGRLVSYALYRWEVAARETVIVGLVGAGGLGRLLQEQRAAFDFSATATTILALIVVSIAVDVVSLQVRRSVRTDPSYRY